MDNATGDESECQSDALRAGVGGVRGALHISPREWNIIGERLGIPDRQLEIIQAFIAGRYKPEDIAADLGITVSTVKTHTERMYRKLNAHSRSDVIITVLVELLAMRS
jgi:DNA-binding NarL/FixJ family response regulator